MTIPVVDVSIINVKRTMNEGMEFFRALSTPRLSTVQRPVRPVSSDTVQFALLIPRRHKTRFESDNETHSRTGKGARSAESMSI